MCNSLKGPNTDSRRTRPFYFPPFLAQKTMWLSSVSPCFTMQPSVLRLRNQLQGAPLQSMTFQVHGDLQRGVRGTQGVVGTAQVHLGQGEAVVSLAWRCFSRSFGGRIEFVFFLWKTRWSPRTRMPTRMLRNRDLILVCHNFQLPLVEHPDLTHWGDTLVGHPCLTLLRCTLVRHSCLTLLLDTLVRHFLLDTLTCHSCKTLLLNTLARHFLLGTSYLTLFWDTLTWHSRETFLLDWRSSPTLLHDTLVRHSCTRLLLDTLTWHSCETLWLDTLVRGSYLTLL